MTTRPLSIGYLVVGLVFLGLSTSWLLHETGVLDEDGFQYLLPVVLLGAGLVGLTASLGKGLRRRTRVATLAPEPIGDPIPIVDLTSDLDQKLTDHQQGDPR